MTMKKEEDEAVDDAEDKDDDDDALPRQQTTTTTTDELSPQEEQPPVASVVSSLSSQRAILASPLLPLDWTQGASLFCPEAAAAAAVIRYPWDVFMTTTTTNNNEEGDELLPPPPPPLLLHEETQVTLVGTAGQKITHMGSDLHTHLSPHITHLILRSHLIRKMEGGTICRMTNLELLELYDNQIEELHFFDDTDTNVNVVEQLLEQSPPSSSQQQQQKQQLDLGNNNSTGSSSSSSYMYCQNLKVLDISYNVIRDMEPLYCCTNLQELCKCCCCCCCCCFLFCVCVCCDIIIFIIISIPTLSFLCSHFRFTTYIPQIYYNIISHPSPSSVLTIK